MMFTAQHLFMPRCAFDAAVDARHYDAYYFAAFDMSYAPFFTPFIC